jgi:hypothetical protein
MPEVDYLDLLDRLHPRGQDRARCVDWHILAAEREAIFRELSHWPLRFSSSLPQRQSDPSMIEPIVPLYSVGRSIHAIEPAMIKINTGCVEDEPARHVREGDGRAD